MNFKKWLQTYIEEKGLSDEGFIINSHDCTHYVDMPFLIDFLANLTKENQQEIKNMLVKIDFLNGDAMRFLQYYAKGYVEVSNRFN